MKKYLLSAVCFLLIHHAAIAQSNDQNYKQMITPRYAIMSGEAVVTGNIDQSLEEITYYNGLGYPMQAVQRSVSPTKQDLVSPVYYDAYGLESKKYLPFKNATNMGTYEPVALSKQASFYSSSIGVEHTPYPYAESKFDRSPLNRVVEQGFPGTAFQPGSTRTIKTNSRTNDNNDQVIVFGYDYLNALPQLHRSVNTTLSTSLCRATFATPGCALTYPANGLYTNTGSMPDAPNSPAGDRKCFGFNYPTSGAHNNMIRFSAPAGSYVLAFYARNTGSAGMTIYVKNNSTVIYSTASINSGWNELLVDMTSANILNITIGITGPGQIVLMDDIRLYNLNNASFIPEYYPLNTLNVTDQTDENGNKSTVFKDRDGNVILKRDFLSPTDVTETYYVYNNHGLLAAVIPPKGVKNLSTNNYLLTSPVNIMNKYGYSYKYDERKRMIEKKSPDNNITYLVYDKQDRVALSQDNNMRSSQNWLFNKYDELGRLVYTGIYNKNSSRSDIQVEVNNHAVEFETLDGSLGFGYTSNAFPAGVTEPLSIFFYDTYDTDKNGTDDWTDVNKPVFGIIPYSRRVFGLPTAIKHRIKDVNGNDSWATKVFYYDKNQRELFTIEYFPIAGYNARLNAYNFNGQVTNTKTFHALNSVVPPLEVNKRFEYDHSGKLKHTWIKPPGMPEVLMSKMTYNDIGQAVVKKIHSYSPDHPFLQTIDYKYHIHGWLKAINSMELGKEDLFGMEFQYENLFTHTNAGGAVSNIPQHNGNISSYQWISKRDVATRGYVFAYDRESRIIDATYFGVTPAKGTTPPVSENGRYNANNFSYDENGNIRSMNHYGLAAPVTLAAPTPVYGQIDKFSYTYDGNQLLSVTDNAAYPITQLNDLTDRNKAGSDFAYDANGNLTTDLDKNVSSIIYNHLNLPVKIQWNNGEKMEITYDAAGHKWASEFFNAAGVSMHHYQYFGEFIYYNNFIDVIQHEEGRLVAEKLGASGTDPVRTGKYLYHYDYTDHQGNVRMTYTPDLDPNGVWRCTYEEPDVRAYPYVQDPDDPQKPVFVNWNQPIRTPNQAYESVYGGKVTDANGTMITLDVQMGDTIEAEVQSKSSQGNTPGDQAPPNSWLYLFGINPGTVVYDQEGNPHYSGPQLSLSLLGLLNNLLQLNANTESERAGALLVRGLDSAGNYVDGQMINAYYSSSWKKLKTQYLVTNPLLTKIQILLTAKANNTVYYDDLSVMRKRMLAKIVQENHYYPYGLNIKGLEYIAPPYENSYSLYNGKEMVLKNQLEWNDYGARYYDPQIGRWHAVDELAEKYSSFSPYHYSASNPIRFVDYDGRGFGDYYDKQGNYLGSDGINDDKVYQLKDGYRAKFENTNINWGGALSERYYTDLQSKSNDLGFTHEAFVTGDASSDEKIQSLHPAIRMKATDFIKEANANSPNTLIRVSQGFRTYEEQDALYAQGRTLSGAIVTKAKGGFSNHNFGLAFDIVGITNGKSDYNLNWKSLSKIGKSKGFEWGGDWKFKDMPHFENMFRNNLKGLRGLNKNSKGLPILNP
jgi:RHS repeat-associated protein